MPDRSARGTRCAGTKQRKRRESNPQGSSLARFRAGCRHPSACPSGIHQAPGEGLEPPRRGRLINSEVRLPFRHPGNGKLCTYEEIVDRRRAGHCFCSTFSSLLSPAQFFAALAEKIGVAGLEPAVSCSRSRRISHLSHTPRKCPARVELARSPWQGDRLPLHHGHERTDAELSKRPRAPGGGRTHVTALRERCLAC